MEKVKVEGHPDLLRDSSSRAVVNANTIEYNNYINTYKSRRSEKDRLSFVESDLKSLKNEIDEIKRLLIQLNNH